MTATALYRLYDTADVLLYTGISLNPPVRFKDHARRSWWQDVARSTLEWLPDLDTALAAEKAAIETERPIHNRALTVPPGDHGERCARIAELRAELDDLEARATHTRQRLMTEVIAATRGAGRGVATEVAAYARWSPAHVRLIRDGKVT